MLIIRIIKLVIIIIITILINTNKANTMIRIFRNTNNNDNFIIDSKTNIDKSNKIKDISEKMIIFIIIMVILSWLVGQHLCPHSNLLLVVKPSGIVTTPFYGLCRIIPFSNLWLIIHRLTWDWEIV